MRKGKKERECVCERERESKRCYWRKEMEESCLGKYKWDQQVEGSNSLI
jgi:hypothetical protein